MAFAAPDPKRVKGDKDRIQRERKAAIKREREAAEMRRQVARCYKDHTPKQIAHASSPRGGMMACRSTHDRILRGELVGRDVIGESRGNPLVCYRVAK